MRKKKNKQNIKLGMRSFQTNKQQTLVEKQKKKKQQEAKHTHTYNCNGYT